jgi:Fibronectin type III domain
MVHVAGGQSANGTSTTVPGLQYGQTYFFKIAAGSPIGSSAMSNEAHATIVPATPTGVSAAAGNGTATLKWSAATGAVTYNLYEAKSSGGEGAQPVMSGIAGTTATLSGLSNGTTYYFKVAGVDTGGPSTLSAEVQATPAAPGGGGALGSLELALLGLLSAWRWHVARGSVGSAGETRDPRFA